jgi:hypothetical protein
LAVFSAATSVVLIAPDRYLGRRSARHQRGLRGGQIDAWLVPNATTGLVVKAATVVKAHQPYSLQ